MVNRALLVGCNYPGTNAALNGCINDVWGTKNMLMTYYGFQESDIIVQIDTDPAYEKPTGRNMKTKLAELVAASQGDDVLVFHFSGHGTQIPGEAGCDETDGKDEAICPCDMNCITDDDLREILKPLAQKPGVKFTFIADCCHSGTLLDHQAVIITGPKEGGPPPPAIDVQGIQNMLAALGAGGKRDFKNRALPLDDLLGFLSNMLGSEVTRGNVRGSMGSIFGADASAKARSFVQYATMAQSALHSMTGGQRAPGGVGSVLSGLLGMCIGVASQVAGPGGVPNNTAEGAPQNGTVPVPPPQAGAKPPPGQQLPDEVGILITGCQDKETSADACPSGDKAKAHGALSNALHTVVKEHHEKNPGVPLTYRNMVIGVRDALAKTGFAQNPCLECSQKYADTPFVGHA